MPDSVAAHLVTGFSQMFYQPVFDTITTIYENWECELWVRLILNNLLAL